MDASGRGSKYGRGSGYVLFACLPKAWGGVKRNTASFLDKSSPILSRRDPVDTHGYRPPFPVDSFREPARYSEGVTPKNARNALPNMVPEEKPTSSAICSTPSDVVRRSVAECFMRISA